MDAADEASDPLERVRILEFGSTAAAARIDRKTIAFEIVQAAAFGNQWGHHRDFAVGKLGGKGMLFENLLIAPALRAIELRDHDAAIFHPGLIDTIFVTVEGEQTAIASPSDRFKGVKDPVRLQRREGMRRLRVVGRVRRSGHSGVHRSILCRQRGLAACVCP